MSEIIEIKADETHGGMRIDAFLATAINDATRSFLKKLIKDGKVSLNGRPCKKPSKTVLEGDAIAGQRSHRDGYGQPG